MLLEIFNFFALKVFAQPPSGTTLYEVLNTTFNFGNGTVTLRGYLCTLSTIITIVIIVVLCCLFISKLVKGVAHLMVR